MGGGPRLVRCFVLSTSASILCLRPLGTLRLAKVTGPRRTPSFGDPSAVGSPGDWGQKGCPDVGAAGSGESSGISGSLVQPCTAQTGELIHFRQ